MKTKNLFWLSAAALLMTACTNEENISMNSSLPIQFNGGITASRVSNGMWETNDEIGVSMRGTGIDAVENVAYVTPEANGSFQAKNTALEFPEEATDVTFYAYYPYSTTLSNNTLTFDVDGKTDVLYATAEVKAAAQTNNTVELNFNHALSQVKLVTSGFPDDITVTLSESCKEATMDITTGTVTKGTVTNNYSVPFTKVATTTSDDKEEVSYLTIALPCSSESKTLTITSIEAAQKWTYTFNAAFEKGHQYAYKATATSTGVNFASDEENPVPVWEEINTTPTELQNPETSEIELTIAQYLAGKTFVPNMNYFYDSLGEDGNGWLNNPDTYFGEHIGSPNPWDQYLYNGCKIASISFYYDEKNEKLMANSVNAIGDNKDQTEAIDGIEVTIDEANRRLTFSKEPFNYNWIFTEILDPTKSDVTYWQLIAHTGGSNYNVDFTSTPIKDFFKDDQLHLTYWNGGNNNCYFVVNFVQKEISETAAE